ncbi:hypothetical protein F5Y15DRAFT_404390 [Xylariaceae sp. FL0016]|nr:hypothetical protein F5Y15DRAFT_404390 [Xylariaceae sp. FL0016]
MEAISAVGFSSNVLQLVEFTTRLITTYRTFRHPSNVPEAEDYVLITTHLKAIARSISTSAESLARDCQDDNDEEKALRPVVRGCHQLAERLLARLRSFRA